MTRFPSQQELPQDDELPHDEELLPHDEELLPQDDELPPEQSLDDPPLAPASHQDEWVRGLPASCADVPPCVPVPVGHAPRPGTALGSGALAHVPRSSQARRHARRTIQVATVTRASTHTPTSTNAINMTSPFRRACAPTARRMPRGPAARSAS
ncbi:hypothetical protein H0H10_26305 [Streptomyces sp. TRM S81-3]|uniref:Uncharacterized protein n=1 Tax=Streptomyces griseicoloratus TaxID=2752516 RepID=A0A926L962_9ACTN|nr:hypothetical protein [Streptomyces griseicoloratus]MBD0422631.1 hypothetical protein [Streptomyces griseicoloratus]